MEMLNTGFIMGLKFTECDRQEPESLTGLCSGNALHLGGAAFRTISLFFVVIPEVEMMKTVIGNSITWFVMSGGGHLQNMELIRFSEDLGKR